LKTIERCFADMKEKCSGRYVKHSGIAKVTMKALLIFACMIIKEMPLWGDKMYNKKLKLPAEASIE
jgi:hypothetical protein